MKRWLVRICVFLILGAIVNVAVAWGCVLLADTDPIRVQGIDATLAESVIPPHVKFSRSAYDFTELGGGRYEAFGFRTYVVNLTQLNFATSQRSLVLFVADAGSPSFA